MIPLLLTSFRSEIGVFDTDEPVSFGGTAPRPARRGAFGFNAGRPVAVGCFSYTMVTIT